MAEKKTVFKNFRVSEKTEKILKEIYKRDFLDFPTVVRHALLEYVQKRQPDLYDALAEEFTPQ